MSGVAKVFVYDLEYENLNLRNARFVAKSKIEADKIVANARIDRQIPQRISYVGQMRSDGTIKGAN